jgi:hypothetical protein
MVADLIEPHKHPDAYVLLCSSNNIGIAIGPAVGGFIATTSYYIAFTCAVAGLIGDSLLSLKFEKEKLPKK